MENNVEKFDPSKLMDGVKDRIKATFVSLIPDDQWEVMVKKEVQDFFFTAKSTSYSSSSRTDFSQLVESLLKEECKKRFIEYLASPEFNIIYEEHGAKMQSETINKVIIENSGQIMVSVFAGMFGQMLSQFRQNMLNPRGY